MLNFYNRMKIYSSFLIWCELGFQNIFDETVISNQVFLENPMEKPILCTRLHDRLKDFVVTQINSQSIPTSLWYDAALLLRPVINALRKGFRVTLELNLLAFISAHELICCNYKCDTVIRRRPKDLPISASHYLRKSSAELQGGKQYCN